MNLWELDQCHFRRSDRTRVSLCAEELYGIAGGEGYLDIESVEFPRPGPGRGFMS